MRNNRTGIIVAVVVGLLALAAIVGLLWLRPPGVLNPGATLPPDAQAGEGGVFYETSFDDPATTEWETFDDGFIIAGVEEGALVVTVDDAVDIGGWSGLEQTFGDFLMETTATLVEGRPADSQILVVFRLTDTENYNRFDITFDGLYALTQVREGVPVLVSDFHASPAITTGEGATNTVRIQAVGDAFTFFVNDSGPLPLCVNPDPDVLPIWEDARDPDSGCNGGERVTSWQNGDIDRGKIGLGAQAIVGFDEDFNPLPAQATVAYDGLTVRTPE